jgi:ankyrin repeat protein
MLKSLPKTLNGMYDQIISKISEGDQKYAVKVLQFLAWASRPVTLQEVAHIVAMNINSGCIDQGLDNAEDILDICANLVTLSSSGEFRIKSLRCSIKFSIGVLSLAHFTVKEYLTSKYIAHSSPYSCSEQLANTFIAQTCLAYLLQFDTYNPVSVILKEYPLAHYAAEFWMFHAKRGDLLDLHQAIMDLLQSKNTPFVVWIQLFNPDKPYQLKEFPSLPTSAPLYYASLGGLYETVQLVLLKHEVDINASGGRYGNALQAASAQGHKGIVQLLLKHKADVNAQGGEYGNALQAASCWGHGTTVQLLLEHKADVNLKGGRYGNALQAASVWGYKPIVQLLLDHRADINAQGGRYCNALQAASAWGFKPIVQLLLDHRADVNAQGGRYGNALQAASAWGYKPIVQLLLDHRADVNVQGGKYGNALQAASAWGYKSIVQLLLEHKADVNVQGGRYGNALQAASDRGYTEIVQLLQLQLKFSYKT